MFKYQECSTTSPAGIAVAGGISNHQSNKKTMTENELMDFMQSLWNRGLLTKSPDELDYEWVIWDYKRIKSGQLFCDLKNDNNIPTKPAFCGDCGYWRKRYQYNPDAADGSGPGRCYILQVPHPRHKHDPACCQLIPQSKGEVCGFCDGEKWINEDVLTKPCPSCGGTGIKHK
jgi:hypothetical protein